MRYVIGLMLMLSSSALAGQDRTVTTDSTVKSDNGTVVTTTGCVVIGGATNFMLTNITSAAGKAGKNDAVTAPVGGSYALIERDGVDLGQYIDHKVELTGVIVPAATKGDKDDKFQIKETTEVDVANGPNRKSSSTKTVKVPRGAANQFLVATVKPLAQNCEP